MSGSKQWFRKDDVTLIRTVDFVSRLNKPQWRYFVQIFVNSVERLNNPVYSAPPCIFLLSVLPSDALLQNADWLIDWLIDWFISMYSLSLMYVRLSVCLLHWWRVETTEHIIKVFITWWLHHSSFLTLNIVAEIGGCLKRGQDMRVTHVIGPRKYSVGA